MEPAMRALTTELSSARNVSAASYSCDVLRVVRYDVLTMEGGDRTSVDRPCSMTPRGMCVCECIILTLHSHNLTVLHDVVCG